jgi:peptide chain release factor subunit 1
MELTYYYNRIAEVTKEFFIDIYPIKGLVVSGPGPTKEDFLKSNYLEYRLQNMVIAVLDTSYSGSEGIREAFVKASDVLSDFRLSEEKILVEKLFREVNSHSGKGMYGLQDVIKYLKNNVVETLLITDDTNLYRLEVKCNRCQNIQEEITDRLKLIPRKTELLNKPCPSCKSTDQEAISQDLVDYLSLLAAQVGTKVEVISGVTEYGAMLSSLGKVGAILRYNPNQ